ncbi:uncharacterized protein BT62DRAFT_1006648 [Guyanagaster necrorhizus]|uniref:Retrotransposon gag domain-containing protein n=1 Tax=Guyanagaster necrorhizus TaxID=856835 RepID=A0A9P8ARQ7_9AGAR|nr:uncharacterized protein BT62DRAFT_1006648 [Guyanagaster necrorhizus MCA 3950]KAG7445623.1 hypothetical protein BT62DRAFT_1006648 [Guyanagaster necrorhizus MCA 3950]
MLNLLPAEAASSQPSTQMAPPRHLHNTCIIPGTASRPDESRSQAPPPYTEETPHPFMETPIWAPPPDGGLANPPTMVPDIYKQRMKEHKLAGKTTTEYFTELERLSTLAEVWNDTTDTGYMVECIKMGLPPVYLTTIKGQYTPKGYDK